MRRWLSDAACLAFIAVGTWACWTRFSTAGSDIPGRTPFRLTSDFFNYYIPMTEAAGARLHAGELPLWNPEACSGMPFLATLQTAVLYPGTWLAALFPAHVLLPWLVVLHCLLGGAFAFALFRAWGCERVASAAGGLLFVFSCCIGQTMWPPAVATICWVPWLLLAVDKVVRGAGPGWWIGLAAGAALQVLAGFPQYLLYGYAVVVPVAVLRLVQFHRSGVGSGRASGLRLLAATSAIAVGFALAGVQLLPALELVQQSARAETLTAAQVHYLHPASRFVGSGRVLANALDGSPAGLSFGEPGSGYLGTPTLFFIAIALVVRRREPLAWLLLGLGAASLVLSDGYLGRWPGLYSGFAGVPLLGSLRTPERLRLIVCLCAVGLAALGLSGLQRAFRSAASKRQATIVLVGSAAVLAFAGGRVFETGSIAPTMLRIGLSLALGLALVWSSGARLRAGAGVLLLVLLAADVGLATATRATLRDIPETWVSRYRHGAATLPAEKLEELRTRAGDGRLGVAELLPFTGGGATGGIRRVSCYEPLAPAQWTRLDEKLGTRREGGVTLSKLEGRAGSVIEDVTSVRGRVILANGAFSLKENADALPRAYFMAETRMATLDAALDALSRGELRPRAETLVERDLGVPGPERPPSGAEPRVIPARILEERPERVAVSIDAPERGLLVLTDTDYPGWQATVDGEVVPIVRANGVHRSVVVSGGRHRVVFAYRPASLRRGALLSGAAVAIVLGVAVRAVPGRRRGLASGLNP